MANDPTFGSTCQPRPKVLDIGSHICIACHDPTSVAKVQLLTGVVLAYDNSAIRIATDNKSHIIFPWNAIVSIQVS